MRGRVKKVAAFTAAAVLVAAGSALAVPEVTGVSMTQREFLRYVDIGYTLAGEAAIVTLSIETNGVALPDNLVTTLSGDVCKVVEPGARSIVWNAGADWPENVTENAKARVTVWQTNTPPQIMVVDISKGTTATAGNPYPVYYFTSVDALPGGGLSNTVYKLSCLVFRKMSMSEYPYGVFDMGDAGAGVYTRLTRDYYAGIFEVTQGQWNKVMGTNPSYFTEETSRMIRPVEKVSYDNIRGSAAEGGAGWPANSNVYIESFVGRIRAWTTLSDFDLPTDAQWEYACRAGTTTYYSDGLGTPANTSSNAQMDVLGRYRSNGGVINGTQAQPPDPPSKGSAIVGSYQPNAWGLYDMHGNAWEWCLDFKADPPEGGVNPDGADSGERVRRGGSWANSGTDCRSAGRAGASAGYKDEYLGFRLFRTLP